MMSKKYFFQAMAMMLGVVLSVSIVSCGDDDDEPGSGSSTQTPTLPNNVLSSRLKDVNGNTLLLTACLGEYKYSTNGTLYQCGNDHHPFDVDGLTFNNNYDTNGQFELNRDDFVSKASCVYQKHYEESGLLRHVINEEFSFSYNAEKQLKTMEVTSHQEEYDESGKLEYSGVEHAVYTYTWANGDLEKITIAVSGDVADHGYHPSVYTFTYGSEPNDTRQPVFCQDMIHNTLLIDVHVLGLLGTGPKHFPKSYTLEQTKEDGTTSRRSENVSFTLNSNGSINRENDITYQY